MSSQLLNLFFLFSSLAGPFQPGPPQHARVELLSRERYFNAGLNQQLGIHFILESGWHIYWINPGDSGQPPSFKWKLPPGFTVGEIQWPRPERMQPSKELVDYGYCDEVLLPIALHVPREAKASALAQIAVEVKWLVCREVCIPEHAQLHLTLPATPEQKPAQSTEQLFATAEQLVPRSLPRSWTAMATSTKDELTLVVRSNNPISKVVFFPLDAGQIENAASQTIQPSKTGAKIVLKKSDLLAKPITLLRGVLVIPGGPAYRIEAPVRQPIQ
jgi:DsbC/DsbD-like thiol-disulfide interchange protein